jgi:hypothetical protein
MTDLETQDARLPPRWFVRLAWFTHRGIYRVTGGRFGLWRPRADRRANKWGAMRRQFDPKGTFLNPHLRALFE